MREPAEVEDLPVPTGAEVSARMPTSDERRAHGIPDGVPIFVVTATDGSVEIFPADRWRIRMP